VVQAVAELEPAPECLGNRRRQQVPSMAQVHVSEAGTRQPENVVVSAGTELTR
jgi:hypothetical protein